MKDKKFLALSSLFFLLFMVGMATITLNKPLSGLLRAKNVAPSALKSFIIAFPQKGSAGVEGSQPPTKIKVSVYVRDVNGSVLPGRSVKMAASLPSVVIAPSDTQTTNELGMAQFFITAKAPGKTTLTATDVVNNTTITNAPTIEFTE